MGPFSHRGWILKFFLKENVWDAALNRIRFLFDEFPNVVVSFSGGKDSTVLLELALIVAREKDRLPLKVLWLDQEAEWMEVVNFTRSVMERDEVEPIWLQIPVKLANALSDRDPFLNCWEPGEKWMRKKEENSIHENTFGVDRFLPMFGAVFKQMFRNEKACYLAGVRCQESPGRTLGLTSALTYKWITWGKVVDKKKEHFTFYPLYDWCYQDIWKAIHDNGWEYCRIYDFLFQRGVILKDMRVSNLHHETSTKDLEFLQEIEPDTWNALVERLKGVNTHKHLGDDFSPKEINLPWMFSTWMEYREFLLEKLIENETHKVKFRKMFNRLDRIYSGMKHPEDMYRWQIRSLISNDYEGIKLGNREIDPKMMSYRRYMRGDRSDVVLKQGKRYIFGDEE